MCDWTSRSHTVSDMPLCGECGRTFGETVFAKHSLVCAASVINKSQKFDAHSHYSLHPTTTPVTRLPLRRPATAGRLREVAAVPLSDACRSPQPKRDEVRCATSRSLVHLFFDDNDPINIDSFGYDPPMTPPHDPVIAEAQNSPRTIFERSLQRPRSLHIPELFPTPRISPKKVHTPKRLFTRAGRYSRSAPHMNTLFRR